ncbi:hypothetical protein HNI00_04130 [Thermoleptolyngbya oregonensis NK1-22]|uniref:Uncharacterized protein n=1 Tax=Thermoleptolyngbya oregonensis NK1-22 TaxID=2547457 RepID=A0AA97BKX0_9CYAN|nr:hypothetical protein [Thermoleptolyngbya oregonensis]WOB42432.1 hypothetical protein HNI00_04130 [Thermoleptolyngbya oregonensis NK1-22]
MNEPTPPTDYRMSLREGGAIALGGLLVIVGGIVGLGDKAIRNATDPARAEAIARSMMDYRIPGQVHGLFGINIGSVKMGVVTNAPPAESSNVLSSVQPTVSSSVNPSVPPDGSSVRSSSVPMELAEASQTRPGDRTRVELLIARAPLSARSRMNHTNGESDFSLLSLPGVSISYEIQGEFQPTTSRDQPGFLCEVPTVINIESGRALLTDSPRPVPAIRYEATIELDGQNHSIILMAIGQDAKKTAQQVFESLRCR